MWPQAGPSTLDKRNRNLGGLLPTSDRSRTASFQTPWPPCWSGSDINFSKTSSRFPAEPETFSCAAYSFPDSQEKRKSPMRPAQGPGRSRGWVTGAIPGPGIRGCLHQPGSGGAVTNLRHLGALLWGWPPGGQSQVQGFEVTFQELARGSGVGGGGRGARAPGRRPPPPPRGMGRAAGGRLAPGDPAGNVLEAHRCCPRAWGACASHSAGSPTGSWPPRWGASALGPGA